MTKPAAAITFPPPHIQHAMRVLALNPTRLRIIVYLHSHPRGSTTGAVARALDISSLTALRHIQVLEREGIVISDTPDRTGTRVHYRLQRKAVQNCLLDLYDLLQPDD